MTGRELLKQLSPAPKSLWFELVNAFHKSSHRLALRNRRAAADRGKMARSNPIEK